jgi:hypothetical protein
MIAAWRCAIQRDDGKWYGGRSEEGDLMWFADPQYRYVFSVESEAATVFHQLQQDGNQVSLFAVSGKAGRCRLDEELT